MPVSSIARGREQLVTATPRTPARELVRTMDDRNVGSIIVVEDEKPVGIVTDRDVAMHVVGDDLEHDVAAEMIMTADPTCVGADEGIFELCQKMQRKSVRRMPVVDDEGRLTGIVTLDDLVVLLQDEMEDIANVIRTESPPY
ncbi:MAG: CBS domain-containing protein [Haloarculaceae archaeon]